MHTLPSYFHEYPLDNNNKESHKGARHTASEPEAPKLSHPPPKSLVGTRAAQVVAEATYSRSWDAWFTELLCSLTQDSAYASPPEPGL